MKKTLHYVTGNSDKFRIAQRYLAPLEIELKQTPLAIDEIQHEDITVISRDKAQKAYAIVKKPLLVNDSGWYIDGLNGFPGAYMAYMNKWLTSENILAMLQGASNRTVRLCQIVTYIDKDQLQIFSHEAKGKILDQPTPTQASSIIDRIASFSEDGTTIADEKISGNMNFSFEQPFWHEIGEWLTQHSSP